VRRLAILPLVAALALSACGSSEKTTVNTPFPPVEEQGGRAYADAKSQNNAARLCIMALTDWPDAYSAYDQVTFRIPGPGRDYVCKRAQ
jgi:hypothetical protein